MFESSMSFAWAGLPTGLKVVGVSSWRDHSALHARQARCVAVRRRAVSSVPHGSSLGNSRHHVRHEHGVGD